MIKSRVPFFAFLSLALLLALPQPPFFAGPNFKVVYDRIGEISGTTAAQGQYLEAAIQ